MKMRRNVDRRLQEEVVYAGGPSHDEQLPPLEAIANIYQAPVTLHL